MESTRTRGLWVAWCLCIFIGYVLVPEPVRPYLWWSLGFTTVVLVIWQAIFGRVWLRGAWTLIIAGIACYLAAAALYAEERLAASTGEAAVEHVFFALLLALLITFNLIIVGRQRRSRIDRSGSLDAAVVFVAAAMVSAEYLIYPILQLTTISSTLQSMLITFEVLNVVILATGARVWFASDPRTNTALRVLVIGEVVLVAGSALSASYWLPQNESYNLPIIGLLTQICGLLFFACCGYAILEPSVRRRPSADPQAGVTSRSRVLSVLGLCMLVPSILLLFRETGGFAETRIFVALTVVLTVLLALRVNLLIAGYREAVRREHALREINAGLMRATSMDEVNSRLDDWAGRLVEQPAVTCQLGTLAELEAAGISAQRSRLRNSAGQIRYRTVVAVPGTRPQRRLVIETPDALADPALASLAVLGQSVGMALERLALARRFVERETTARLERLLHNASDVIALVDDNGRIDYVTEAIKDLTNEEPTAVAGMQWAQLFEDPALARALLDRSRVDEESRGDLVIDPRSVAASIARGHASAHAEETEPAPWADRDIISDADDLPERRVEVDVAWLASERQFVVTHHDVTDRYQLEQQLAFQAFHDELTGLNNRVVFRAELGRAAARTRRSEATFAVMMIDLDDFKNVNDSFGHPAGDELLREVAKRLVSVMREGDTPVRLGGDEFAVILESARSAEDAEAVALRLLASLLQPVQLRGTEVVVGASIGIAVSDGNADPADVERDADIALYDAKFAGKNRVALFRTGMHDTAVEKMSLTNQLRGALHRNEIEMRYQPIFELPTGRIAGVEALIRWMHPTRGELVPDMFIPLAEETGVITEIGLYSIRTAIADIALLSAAHPRFAGMRVAINISGKQLVNDDIAETIRTSILETGLSPAQLIIEVTESVLLPEGGAASIELRAVAEAGTSIYIDDFGTGWASLHYLRTLPVTGLKLAQEFVRELPNQIDAQLVRAVNDLSLVLDYEEVIAEGIETTTQRDSLTSLGLRLGQGFLMSRPMPVAQLSEVLTESEPVAWNLPADRSRRKVQKS